MSLLGIDIGSSSCKGVVFNASGKQLAKDSQSYTAELTGSSMVEMNPHLFRDTVFHLIKGLSEKVTDDPIEALAISSHGETIIPVDINGHYTGKAIMNADNRATEEAGWWAETFGKERLYHITGLPLHPMFSLNKILWIKKHQPELYSKTAKFLSVGDYILMQLGLPPCTDFSLASRTMAFDIRNHCWSTEILDHCGIPREKLAVPLPAGTVAGILSKEIAGKLSLKEGTVVALGGHDQPCGALGAGIIQEGEVYLSAGTYECMATVSAKPLNNKKALAYSFNSYCHVVPDKYVTLAFFPAGLVINWFVNNFCYEDKMSAQSQQRDLFDVLEENTQTTCPGPSGLNSTPHFVGSCNPYWDVTARGVMAGFTPGITRYHMYKAIYEGIACELNLNAKALEEVAGAFENMHISGGNAGSAFTIQLRADITGKPIITLKNTEAVCLGAALLAGIATGVYKNAEDAVKKTVQVQEKMLPDYQVRKGYEKQIQRYELIYPSLERFRKT